MVFGGAYGTLRREGAMVVGGNILIGNEGRDEECGEVGRGFVVQLEIRERVREGGEKNDDRLEARDL